MKKHLVVSLIILVSLSSYCGELLVKVEGVFGSDLRRFTKPDHEYEAIVNSLNAETNSEEITAIKRHVLKWFNDFNPYEMTNTFSGIELRTVVRRPGQRVREVVRICERLSPLTTTETLMLIKMIDRYPPLRWSPLAGPEPDWLVPLAQGLNAYPTSVHILASDGVYCLPRSLTSEEYCSFSNEVMRLSIHMNPSRRRELLSKMLKARAVYEENEKVKFAQ